MAGRSVFSFEGLDRAIQAFGGGWIALLALVVLTLGFVIIASARPFFDWLRANGESKRKHERFLREFDEKREEKERRAARRQVKSRTSPSDKPKG